MLQSAQTEYDAMMTLIVSLQIGQACDGEVELARKSGSIFSALLDFVPCPMVTISAEEDGTLFLCTLTDRTSYNKMRKMVRQFVESESNQKAADLTRLIETANAPIIGIDTFGRVNEWNLKAAKITGYSKKETHGQQLSDFITHEYRESTLEVLQMALAGRETSNFEFPLFHKQTGKRVDVLLNATTRRDAGDRVTGVFGVGQDITELRKVAREVERKADDFTKLIETANAPIFGTDIDGNITVWNRKTSELTGFDKDEAIGRKLVANFITPDYREAVSSVLERALRGQETDNYELPLFTKTGKRVHVLLNATTRRDADGKVSGVVGVGQDISLLNKASVEAQRVADDLTRLIDTANAPIFGVDLKGNVTEWNRKSAEIVGYSSQETMGKNFVENFIAAEYREAVRTVLNKALREEETANYELPLFTKSGQRVDVLLNATTRRDADGVVTGVVGVGQDITELKRVSVEAELVADDLTRLIDTANAPIFGVDLQGNVTEWNRKSVEIVGYSKDETMGRNLVDNFITAEFREAVRLILQKAMRGQETANYSLPLFTKTGKRVDVLLNATTRRDSGGNVTGVVGVGQDITELNKISQEAQRVADDLTRLIDTANAPIFGVDLAGNVSEWNRKAQEIVGYSSEETMGKNFVQNFIAEEYRRSVRIVLERAMRGEETANFELPLFTKSGLRVDVLLNATTRRDATGNVTGVVGVGQDITELKRVSMEAELVADDLTRLIDTANAPIFGVDLDGNVSEWNRKSVEIVGYPKDETMGRNLVDNFITAEYRDSVRLILNNALRGQETDNYTLPLFTKRGERVDVLLNATTRRDGQGNITGVVGVGQDITVLNRISEEAQRVADDLTRLIDTANAPIFGTDLNGNVTEWNRKSVEIVGYSSEETMGKNLVDNFIAAEYRDSVRLVLNKALRGEETANYELPLFTKSGERVDVLLNATTRRDGQGSVTGVVGVGQDITRLKQISQEAERVADDLTRLIDTANAPIFGVDLQGNVTEWNRKSVEIVGYSSDETMGRNLVDNFIAAEYRDSVRLVLEKAMRGQETANFELPLFTKSGSRVDVLLNATTRRDDKGQATGVVGVGQDITELKRVSLEAEIVADDLTRLIDTANAPIFGVDLNGNVTEWNRKASDIVGYSKDETMGRDLVDNFIAAEHRVSVRGVFMKAMQGQETANYELPLYTKGGRRVDVLLNATTRRDAQERIVGVVGVGQDITELRKMSAEAQLRADDYRRLIDEANAPIIAINKDGIVTEWNRMTAQLLEYTAEEATGTNIMNVIDEDARAAVADVLRRALAGEAVENFQLSLATKSGAKVELLLNATTRRDTHGNVTGCVCVGQDVTALLKAVAELRDEKERAELVTEEKRKFLAWIFHEVRQPFTVFELARHECEQLLLDFNELDASGLQLKRLLAVDMSNACSSIKRILNDTLRMQKIEEGKVEMEYCAAQIESIVKGPFKTESTVSPSIQMTLHIDPSIEHDWAMLDVPRLHQVMANFLSNARKFTGARDGFPPRINVRLNATEVSLTEIRLKVEVEDTGAGIPHDSIEAVFVPYKQLRAGALQSGGGTGLGLPIAKSLIEAHNGSISCSSEMGKGSIFAFELLVQRCAEPEAGMLRPSEDGYGEAEAQEQLGFEAAQAAAGIEYTAVVAIVDDQEMILQMMHLMLKRAGVSHVMCLDGDEIVKRCAQGERFRIILMDRQMVRMGGEAATRAIRDLGITSAITRIIGLTGDAMAEDMKTFKESGLDEARTKPLLAHEWKEIEARYVPTSTLRKTLFMGVVQPTP